MKPRSKTLDKHFLSEMEAKLNKEKLMLEHELGAITRKDPRVKGVREAKFPNLGSEMEENAAEVAMYSDRISMEGNLEETLASVKRALGRIANGTYGKCTADGKPIPHDRLEALPAAETCIHHAAPPPSSRT